MYAPPPFKPEQTASLAFADARGFGLLRAAAGQDPVASWAPFYLSCAAYGPPQAACHVARHNELVRRALSPSRRLLAIAGGNVYVSTDGYVSGQLPSSPYQAVQLTGRVGKLVRKLSCDELALQLAARLDTSSQQIAGLMRQVRQQAFDEPNRRERSMQ
jgi:transcriptional regulator